MVVIMMIGIVAGISAPQIVKWKTNYAVRKNANDTLSALKYARAHAINIGFPIIFTLSDAGFTLVVDTNSDSVIDASDTVLQNGAYNHTVTIKNNTIGAEVSFNRRGIPSKAGAFMLDNGYTYKTITLYATGGSRIN